jgi:hypothetical protein
VARLPARPAPAATAETLRRAPAPPHARPVGARRPARVMTVRRRRAPEARAERRDQRDHGLRALGVNGEDLLAREARACGRRGHGGQLTRDARDLCATTVRLRAPRPGREQLPRENPRVRALPNDSRRPAREKPKLGMLLNGMCQPECRKPPARPCVSAPIPAWTVGPPHPADAAEARPLRPLRVQACEPGRVRPSNW